MTIPEAAIEAAAEALVGWFGRERSWAEKDAAIAAIEAAMPAIREAIAQEIEAERDEVAKGTGSKSVVHTGGRLWGLNHAARIVRGGTP